jgi:hypothetical protein
MLPSAQGLDNYDPKYSVMASCQPHMFSNASACLAAYNILQTARASVQPSRLLVQHSLTTRAQQFRQLQNKLSKALRLAQP